MSEHMEERCSRSLSLLLAVTVLAAAVRFFNLGGPAFYGDEFSTVASIEGERILEPRWPLIFWSMKAVCAVAGVSEFTVRLLPALFGVAAIPALFFAGRRVFGEMPLLFAGLLIALNHWHLYHSQTGRYYTALFFFSGLAICWLANSLRFGRAGPAFAAGVAVTLSGGFHPTGLWPAITFGAFCLAGLVVPSVREHLTFRMMAAFFGPLILAGGALLFVVILPTAQFIGSTGGWGYGPVHLVLGWTRGLELPVAVLGGCWLLSWLLKKQSRGMGWFALLLGGLPIGILALLAPYVSVRQDYAFSAAPLWFILAGSAVAAVVSNRSVAREARLGVLLAVSASLLPSTISHHTELLTCEHGRVFEAVRKQAGDDDVAFHTFIPMLGYYTGIPSTAMATEPKDLEDQLAEIEASDRVVWLLVRASRTGIEPRLLEEWLRKQATLEARFDAKRFDYEVKSVFVYRYDPRGSQNSAQDGSER